jgi:flagellar protein FliL
MSAASGTPSGKVHQRYFRSKLVGILLLAIAAGGGAAWFVQERDHTADAAKAAEASNVPRYIVHLEGFTVNLADPESTHFLRATIDLGIDHLPDGADPERPALSVPVSRIRDSILSVLTVCTADQLLSPEGKARLKKNLLDALNKSVPEIDVRDIYFTEFLVQR